MNGYLVPANTKKAILILGFLRPIDAMILGFGVGISVLALLIFQNAPTWVLLVSSMPMLIAAVLILPIPNYHNTLVAIQSIFRYYNERRKYIWKGWCVYNEYKDNK